VWDTSQVRRVLAMLTPTDWVSVVFFDKEAPPPPFGACGGACGTHAQPGRMAALLLHSALRAGRQGPGRYTVVQRAFAPSGAQARSATSKLYPLLVATERNVRYLDVFLANETVRTERIGSRSGSGGRPALAIGARSRSRSCSCSCALPIRRHWPASFSSG
jgi:hypothetical protein